MNKLIWILFCLFATAAIGQHIPKVIKVKGPTAPIICPVSHEISHHYVAPRKDLPYKSTATQFNVAYVGSVPAAAKEAFEEGVLGLISDWINTDVVINIEVTWAQLEGNALASAGTTGWYSGFENAPNPDEVYPTALAEKIAGRSFNGDDPDIVININSTVDWYYDYNNTGGIGSRFDFVSVLTHEVFHGLGFNAQVAVDPETGQGLFNAFTGPSHSIYAEFLEFGTQRVEDIPEGSVELGDALTSENVFWNLISDNPRARLAAPSVFNGGRSISHLDQSTYENTLSSLMTPAISGGKVERDAGIALEMLFDMGWDMTFLRHTPETGSEDLNKDFMVTVEVESDSPYKEETLKLIYSRDGFVSDTVEAILALNTTTGLYEGILPATGQELAYSYFIVVENSRNLKFTNPGQAPTNFFTYNFAIDNTQPTIAHRSTRVANDVDPSVTIEAAISDFYIGVDRAFIEWDINGAPQADVPMIQQFDFIGNISNTYAGSLVYPEGTKLVENDKINYRIFAVDKSQNQNLGQAPVNNGVYTLTVEETALPVISYLNDFSVDTDFEGELKIRTVAGFSNGALHSSHPYPEEGGTGFLNFVSELNSPIIIQEENPLIEFDEIAIVEPGDPGTVFGQAEFWDYVIVEGKKSGGSTWIPFLDGYDASSNNAWLSAYNAQANGTPAMFAGRTIDMTDSGDFKAGDIVFIRFRLFSDPFATGWGWAVDNLKIQELSTAVEDFIVEEEFNLYPNPGTDKLFLELNLKKSSDQIQVEIIDVVGKKVLSQRVTNKSINIREVLNITSLNDGLYILNVYFNNRDVLTRKFVKE